MKGYQKVQIQTTKKLDKMLYLLMEQNHEVANQINKYRDKYAIKSGEESKVALLLENGTFPNESNRLSNSANATLSGMKKFPSNSSKAPAIGSNLSASKVVRNEAQNSSQFGSNSTRNSVSGLRTSGSLMQNNVPLTN